jgi:hypothetical protein
MQHRNSKACEEKNLCASATLVPAGTCVSVCFCQNATREFARPIVHPDRRSAIVRPHMLVERRRMPVGSNNEVERRGASLPPNEADLSGSSIPSLAHRSHDHPRSLEPLVRRRALLPPGASLEYITTKYRCQ